MLFILLLLTGTGVFAQSDTSAKLIKPTKFDRKRVFGLAFGAGISDFRVTNSNWKQGMIDYNDSLKSIASQSAFKFDLSFLYLINFSKTLAFRPTATLSIEGTKLQYNKHQSVEIIDKGIASQILSLPFLYKFQGKRIQPYLLAGPSFSFMFGQDDKVEKFVPLKTIDLLGDIGFGIDIDIPKLKIIATPEMKYSVGLLNRKGEANNLYMNTIEQLKRRALTFTIYLRDI